MFRGLVLIFSVVFLGCTVAPKHKGERCPSSVSNGLCGPLMEGSATRQSDGSALPSTGGFEFEGSLPVEMEYSTIASEIKAQLESHYPGDDISISVENYGWYDNQYEVIHRKNGVDYRYTVKPDTRLYLDSKSEPEVKGVEITSPILRTRNQASLFFGVLERLRSYGLKSRSDIAGNHVHYGMRKGATYEDVLRLFKSLKKLLQVFTDQFAYNKNRDAWINLDDFGRFVVELEKFVKANPNTLVTEEKGFDLAFTRRSLVRIEPRLGTIELRIFNSNLNSLVNMFEFEFTMALFSKTLDEETELSQYLIGPQKPEIGDVLKLMGLDPETADEAFKWSQRRVVELTESIDERRNNKSTSRYVLPSPVEIVVDKFWQQQLNDNNIESRLKNLAENVPPRDLGMALFNIISGKDFELLDTELRNSLLDRVEQLGADFAFLNYEVWVIRAVDGPQAGKVLAERVRTMETEDLTVLHPFIRRILLRLEKAPEEAGAIFSELAKSQKVYDRFYNSYDKYIQTRKPSLTHSQVAILGNLVLHSRKSEVGLRVLQLVDSMKFEIRSNVRMMAPFFTLIQEKARKDRRIALETLTVLVSIARNGSLAPSNYVSDPRGWLELSLQHLQSGHYPKLFVAVIEYMRTPNSPLLELRFEKEEFYDEFEVILEKYHTRLVKNEKASLSMAFSSLLYKESDEIQRRFLRYFD